VVPRRFSHVTTSAGPTQLEPVRGVTPMVIGLLLEGVADANTTLRVWATNVPKSHARISSSMRVRQPGAVDVFGKPNAEVPSGSAFG
jgi:hypothetical protein